MLGQLALDNIRLLSSAEDWLRARARALAPLSGLQTPTDSSSYGLVARTAQYRFISIFGRTRPAAFGPIHLLDLSMYSPQLHMGLGIKTASQIHFNQRLSSQPIPNLVHLSFWNKTALEKPSASWQWIGRFYVRHELHSLIKNKDMVGPVD